REARAHVSRMRDLLLGGGGMGCAGVDARVAGVDAGVSVFSTVRQGEGDDSEGEGEGEGEGENGGENDDEGSAQHAFRDFEFGAAADASVLEVLSTSAAAGRQAVPACVRHLALSGWNPVPRHRQLQGDILYVLATTLEGQTYHITAGEDGFFVNASTMTRFNGDASGDGRAHSLAGLLRGLSGKCAQGWRRVQGEMQTRDAAETQAFLAAGQAARPWVVSGSGVAGYDVGRTQAQAQAAAGGESLRDWNEELQSIRELARGTLAERVVRDRQLQRWHGEFSDAAVAGAMAVVEGSVIALNPTDPPEQHMFLRDNIFYSKGFDGRATFAGLGGDAAAHVATGKDVAGVRAVSQADVAGLCTLGSVVVDYRGVRVVAQSVVPGIFRRPEATAIV
ncbi:Intracellular distribution of mitochondria, partial [Coemansia sp. RSA 2320]